MLLQEAKMYLASLIFDSALLILSVHEGDSSLGPEFISGFAVVAVVETFWLLMGRGLRNSLKRPRLCNCALSVTLDGPQFVPHNSTRLTNPIRSVPSHLRWDCRVLLEPVQLPQRRRLILPNCCDGTVTFCV